MTTTTPRPTAETGLAFSVSIDWSTRQVTAAGPLDSITAALLLEAVNVLRRTNPGPITVDLLAVSRLDTAGMLALDEACSQQNWSGSTLALTVTDRIAFDLVRNGHGTLIGHPTWRPGSRPNTSQDARILSSDHAHARQ